MEFKTAMTFNSHKKDRTFFLLAMLKFFHNTITYDHRELIVLITEILKNIYDHTDGYGQLYVKKEYPYIKFEIKDFGTKNFNIEKLAKPGFSNKKGNGVNFGRGLDMAILNEQTHEMLGLKLTLDTSSGFKYKGKYDMRILGREK